MARPAPTARSSALRILNSVLGEGRLMSEVLGTGLLDPLSAPDRARAQRLANDTLRGMERADRLKSSFAQTTPPVGAQCPALGFRRNMHGRGCPWCCE